MRIATILLILNIFCLYSKAATFTVTNNANEGIGSLRQAILDAGANGSLVADVINFNLSASIADDVTINLTEELPALSSNLIINATTQPTNLLNNLSIRIKLVRSAAPYFHGFVIDGVENIQIYGFYFSNFLSQAGVTSDERKAGIFLKNTQHIIIGAPNMQNGFGGNYTSIISPTVPSLQEDIKISSNIIGLDPTGTSITPNIVGIDLSYIKNSTIGGLSPVYGNLISGNANAVSLGGLSGNVNILFNVVGLDVTKTKSFPANLSTGIFANGENVNLLIADNYVASQLIGIKVDNNKGSYSIKHNTIGTALNNQNFGNTKFGIELYNCGAGIVGGTNINDQNVIAYNEQAIQVDLSYPVSILKNSIYCNSRLSIGFKDLPVGKNITQSKITFITANSASGTYLPNSRIELFYDDECPDCQGKIWVATITTNADGSWQYNGPLAAGITSTGTNPDGATSAFSKPLIADGSKIITDVFCGGTNGSISNLTITDASIYNWFNASNELVGNTRDLTNVPAGTYYLQAGQPGGCASLSAVYTIKSIDINYKVKTANITPASCNQKNGAINISGYESQTPVYFSWADQNGNVVSTTEMLTNVFPGTYTLTASNGNNCTNIAGTFVVAMTEAPVIDLSALQKFISCDGKFISATGISVKGNTGPYLYNWFDENGTVIYSNLEIQGIKPGKYTLVVTDKYGCAIETENIDFTKLENKVLQVPNSISPNGDGTNDTWKITGAQNYPDAEFYVFNRNGDKVFYSKGYVQDFDGTIKGKPLPVGVYYYLIDLKTGCGRLSGSLTILK